jgi:hypothetical protein
MPTGRPICPGCGERIGVYEPVWHLTDAGPEATSFLRLLDQQIGELWHVQCAEAAGVAPA